MNDLERAHQLLNEWQDEGSPEIFALVTDWLLLENKLVEAFAECRKEGKGCDS